RSQSPGAASAASLGWIPAVANTSGSRRASSQHALLEAAVMPTAIIPSSPAARARWSTAGRSAAGRSAARWAGGAISPAASGARRLELRCLEALEGRQVLPLDGEQLLDLAAGAGVRDARQVGLQLGHQLPLLLDQARQEVVQADEVAGREAQREGRQVG